MLEHNPDTVKIVLKNFPLTSIHKFAEKSALAALAAGEQGKYWPFHDELFSSPEINDTVIDQIVTKLGLNKERFKKDINSTKVQNILARDIQDAEKANVDGTPALFINGRKVGSRNLGAIQKMIDLELKKIKSDK